MDAVIRNMIYTMFLRHPDFDYSCLGEAVIALDASYKQMARRGEITLKAPMREEIPSTPLESTHANILQDAVVPPQDLSTSEPPVHAF